MTKSSEKVVVAALYKFAALPGYRDLRAPLLNSAEAAGVLGTLLLASEGINGTIAGTREGIDDVLAFIRTVPGLADLTWKESFCDEMPFLRLKVRLKSEIVTMGVEAIDPEREAGTYVDAQNWNELISDPDTVVIDTRNDYEVGIGTFEGAINPETSSFREFPEWVERHLDREQQPKVAMFCTGGIRCEKATAHLKRLGFENVFHLKGGVLKYLETVPEEESLWHGECYVFDRRVSVGHGLKSGPYQMCSICREPFESHEGRGGYASRPCPGCEENAAPERRERADARQRQIDLAAARGRTHLGPGRRRKY